MMTFTYVDKARYWAEMEELDRLRKKVGDLKIDTMLDNAGVGTDDGWIEWSGGKQPIADYVSVEVELASGVKLLDVADGFDWDESPPGQIVRYRVVEQGRD